MKTGLREGVEKVRKAGLKTPVISLIVLIGISILIFFISDSTAEKKAKELGDVSNLNWIIPLGDYEYIEHLQNGAGMFVAFKNQLAGVISANGDIIIPCVYDHIGGNSEAGLIRGTLQGKQGYLNEAGSVAIPFIYDKAYDFCGGYALVSLKGRYQVIGTAGEIVYENPEGYQMYPTEKEGIFSFWKGKGFEEEWGDVSRKAYKGLIDARTGAVLVKPDRYQEVFCYSEGFWLTSVYPEKRPVISVSVFLDENLSEVFHDKVFHEARPFSEGFAAVTIVEGATDRDRLPDAIIVDWGYMDKEGNMLESDLFLDTGSPFSDGLAGEFDESRLFFINTSGQEVFEIKRKGNFKLSKEAFQEGFAPVATGSSKSSGNYGNGMIRYGRPRGANWGYVDKEGVFVVPPIFQDASPVAGGLAVVKHTEAYGVISIGATD